MIGAIMIIMSISTLTMADTTVTYHFYNANKWENVGAFIKQGIDWSEDCRPLDKCVLKDTIDGTAPHEPIWPGATMEAEGNDWYTGSQVFIKSFMRMVKMIFDDETGNLSQNLFITVKKEKSKNGRDYYDIEEAPKKQPSNAWKSMEW